jgi:hypothetical protein
MDSLIQKIFIEFLEDPYETSYGGCLTYRIESIGIFQSFILHRKSKVRSNVFLESLFFFMMKSNKYLFRKKSNKV